MSTLEATLLVIWVIPIIAVLIVSFRIIARSTDSPTSYSAHPQFPVSTTPLLLERDLVDIEIQSRRLLVTVPIEAGIENHVAVLYLN